MIIEAVQQLAGLFSRRFFFNALLPTFTFTSLTLGVAVVGGGSTSEGILWWNRLDLLGQFLLIFAYVALVYMLAAALASQWRNVVRLYEGYPLARIASRLGRVPIGKRWHQETMQALLSEDDRGRPDQAYYRYPPEQYLAKVLPTRLGNILLAGERYPQDRYGIDAIYFWPRLYPLLPEQYQREYELAVIQYQFPLVVSFLSAISAFLSGLVLVVQHASPIMFAVVFLGGIAVAYAAYVLALMSAIELSEIQRSAFDLYRSRLLIAWPSVQDVTDEKAAFRRIRSFVVQGASPSWASSHDAYMSRHRQDQTIANSAYGPE